MKLNKYGWTVVSILMIIALVSAAWDCPDWTEFIVSKIIAVVTSLIATRMLIVNEE